MSFGKAEADALIEAVRAAARSEILPHFRRLDAGSIDTKSAPDDLVTIADRAAELAIAKAARDILPDAAIIGEEAVSEDGSLLDQIAGPGLCVIIDPIDGTWNFANGISTFGVILAVVENGETVFGLLYDPSHDDWIMAHRGQGAWFAAPGLAPQKLSVGAAPERSEMFGLIALYLFDKARQAKIAQTLPDFHRIATLRCSCHEYRLLAAGRTDFCLNGMLNAWDHAAGALIYREAGGIARLLTGEEYLPTMREGYLLTANSEQSWAELAELYSFL